MVRWDRSDRHDFIPSIAQNQKILTRFCKVRLPKLRVAEVKTQFDTDNVGIGGGKILVFALKRNHIICQIMQTSTSVQTLCSVSLLYFYV